jgi:hypothetical protein
MTTGSSIQCANGAFTNGLSASLTCPDRTGLIGEYIFGANSARSQKNIANNAVPLTPTGAGTPVYNANSILLSGSASYGNGIAGYDTGIVCPNTDITFIVVRKKVAQGSLSALGQAWFGVPNFTGFLDYDNWDFYNNQGGTPPNTAKVADPGDTAFHFAAGVGPNGAAGTIYVGTAGVLTSNTGPVAGAVRTGTLQTIKLVPTGGYQMELAYAAIYNRALTSQQVTNAYASLQAYYAALGITVS